jgi:hypothetical protein
LWLNDHDPVVFDPNLHKQHARQRIALGIVGHQPGRREISLEPGCLRQDPFPCADGRSVLAHNLSAFGVVQWLSRHHTSWGDAPADPVLAQVARATRCH